MSFWVGGVDLRAYIITAEAIVERCATGFALLGSFNTSRRFSYSLGSVLTLTTMVCFLHDVALRLSLQREVCSFG